MFGKAQSVFLLSGTDSWPAAPCCAGCAPGRVVLVRKYRVTPKSWPVYEMAETSGLTTHRPVTWMSYYFGARFDF
jgi:hypothetical protein